MSADRLAFTSLKKFYFDLEQTKSLILKQICLYVQQVRG